MLMIELYFLIFKIKFLDVNLCTPSIIVEKTKVEIIEYVKNGIAKV